MAAQLVAAHNAAMDCYRRAAIPEQYAEARRENLAHAGKLSRTFATLLEALNRHRGKGQQGSAVAGGASGSESAARWRCSSLMASNARQSPLGGFFGLSLNSVIFPFFMRLLSAR